MTSPAAEPAKAASRPARVNGWLLAPVIGFLAVAGIFIVALMSGGDPSKLPSALIGKPAPAITMALPLLDGVKPGVTEPGQAKRPAVFGQGYPVLVNYFASWCPPCRVEHPLLIDLARTTGLPILGVNQKDTTINGRRFLDVLGNPYERVAIDADGRAGIEWGVYGMPETFLVDGKGTVVWKHVGPLTADVIQGKLREAVKRAADGAK